MSKNVEMMLTYRNARQCNFYILNCLSSIIQGTKVTKFILNYLIYCLEHSSYAVMRDLSHCQPNKTFWTPGRVNIYSFNAFVNVIALTTAQIKSTKHCYLYCYILNTSYILFQSSNPYIDN